MGGAAVKLKRDASADKDEADREDASRLVSTHYDDIKKRFDKLDPTEQKFYVDKLNAMHEDLGTVFST